ncbi:Uncharacterized protein Rs2_01070 [Raphanus sativus]|nr:Uncharacterized protein Rs2_01070 [Raphanus sativus]
MAKRVARGCNLQRKERRRTVKTLTARNEDSRSRTLKRMRRSSGGHSEQRRPSVMSDRSSPEQQSPERVMYVKYNLFPIGEEIEREQSREEIQMKGRRHNIYAEAR